jgi:hypothetical protein
MMKLFRCQNCEQLVFFENTSCERCGHALGFLPGPLILSSLVPVAGAWHAAADDGMYRFCANAEHKACNWLVPAPDDESYCRACRHNATIPDLSVGCNLANWRELEMAKHRLIYSLLRLRLPLATRRQDSEHGLAFEFLADPPADDAPKVITGHDSGLITISVSEAEPAKREALRQQMGETYRTLLGHFRHEIGHYYWDLLIRDGEKLDAFRAAFGDERGDYGAALNEYYTSGPPTDWHREFVSAYAASHPWEDFAESWAHYLHIVDALETAGTFGLRVRPRSGSARGLQTEVDFDPYTGRDAATLVDAWLPVTFAVNSLNRSMGQPDLYPFVLPPPAIAKLQFIHDLVARYRDGHTTADRLPATVAPASSSADQSGSAC